MLFRLFVSFFEDAQEQNQTFTTLFTKKSEQMVTKYIKFQNKTHTHILLLLGMCSGKNVVLSQHMGHIMMFCNTVSNMDCHFFLQKILPVIEKPQLKEPTMHYMHQNGLNTVHFYAIKRTLSIH